MQFDHPQLESRLEQVLGESLAPYLPKLSVLSLQFRGAAAAVELQMNFSEAKIPRNFQKKSRNCLILLLDIPDFVLDVTSFSDQICENSVDVIKTDGLVLNIGKYQYQFAFDSIQVARMQSVNDMDLVEAEW